MTEGASSTNRGMPVVTEETLKAIREEFTKGSEQWGQHLERVKARIIEEQPHLIKLIESQVGKYPQEMHNQLFEIFVATYAVLEQQSNSNKMSSSFSVSTEEKG
jgi:hypothetical protein